jgi:hypothetical protein
LKCRFKLTSIPPEFSFCVQVKIPPALATLQNFIRCHDTKERFQHSACTIDTPDIQLGPFDNQGESDYLGSNNEIEYGDKLGHNITPEERQQAENCQDQIAQAMWEDYENELARRAE